MWHKAIFSVAFPRDVVGWLETECMYVRLICWWVWTNGCKVSSGLVFDKFDMLSLLTSFLQWGATMWWCREAEVVVHLNSSGSKCSRHRVHLILIWKLEETNICQRVTLPSQTNNQQWNLLESTRLYCGLAQCVRHIQSAAHRVALSKRQYW